MLASGGLLEVDFPKEKPQSEALRRQNLALKKQFNVSGYPTILLLDIKGNELGRSGYKASPRNP